MIERYALSEMKALWSQGNKFRKWLEVELAIVWAWTKLEKIPQRVYSQIKQQARFDIRRITELEEKMQHDMNAFVACVQENLGENARYFHMGMTSYDIEDPALSLLLIEAADIILEDLRRLIDVVYLQAKRHKWTLKVGRTHGVHAEPTTLGHEFAVWFSELKEHLFRIQSARESISYSKISGAVGTYSTVPPELEEIALKKLRLKPMAASTQIVPRTRHAAYVFALANLASSLAHFATQIRLGQQTERAELAESFAKGQKGSSAMPHKKNPIICERICGLNRLVQSKVIPALENIVTWDERDISHSSVERAIFPETTTYVDYMLQKFTKVAEELVINPENMLANLEKTKGRIASQKVKLLLLEKGMEPEKVYYLVQRCAFLSEKEGKDFREVLENEPEIVQSVTKEELEACFNWKEYVKNLEVVYERLGI